jgi:hypothetical protein
MKTKVPAHSGGRKVAPGPKQAEAHEARRENQKHKRAFKDGAFVRNHPTAGRARP